MSKLRQMLQTYCVTVSRCICKWENYRNETGVVRTCRRKDGGICNNGNVAKTGRPTLSWGYVTQKDSKITYGRSSRQKKLENENSLHHPLIGKRPKKKRCEVYVFMNNISEHGTITPFHIDCESAWQSHAMTVTNLELCRVHMGVIVYCM